MRTALVGIALLAWSALIFASSPAHAQGLTEYTGSPAFQSPDQAKEGEPDDAREKLKQEAARLSKEAQARVRSFADYSSEMLEGLADPPGKGWTLFGLCALLSLISLLWGWTLIQSLLIPFAPVWGLATGGITAFCIVQAFYTSRPPWFRLALLAVGIAMGLGLYLFAALRAKPIAAFLVVMSPFLIVAALTFDFDAKIGLAIFCCGFLAGFAGMVQVRPLAILSTSMLGAVGFLGCWGLLAHLLRDRAIFVQDSFAWLTGNPLMLILAWGVFTFLGTNFQFTTGPRGALEE